MRLTASGRKLAILGAALACALVAAAVAATTAAGKTFPRYNHIFLMIDENHDYHQIIGNPAAPVINALAHDYGLATNYHGVADPSEPNYVAMLGGSFFGIEDDEPYYFPGHTIDEPNLISQLEEAGLSWKGYFQGMPYAGYRGYCFPAKCNGIPDSDTQYVAKHNGIPSFADNQTPSGYDNQVPYGELARDLADGDVANFNYIVPDECDDMHGAPPWCIDSNKPFTVEDNYLVSRGDAFVRQTVEQITSSPVWQEGTNAIVFTSDEGEFATDKIPAIVITNHGPRGVTDNTHSNHYSLLRSLQEAFGLGCLLESCAAKPLTALFEVTGSTSTPALPEPFVPEPDGTETVSPTGPPVNGKPATLTTGEEWQVVPSPHLTPFDNNLAGVSAASPTDAWAVGNYYPKTNNEVYSTLGEHWNGKRWTAYALPDVGPNENSLLAVSELPGGGAWAVGYYATADYQQRTLIEHYNGTSWEVVSNPNPGPTGDIFYGVSALSEDDVWAIGAQRHGEEWIPLAEHWDGSSWSVVPVPAPPGSDTLLYAVSAVSSKDIYAVGQSGYSFPSQTLLEHWNGYFWAPVPAQQDPTETLTPLGLDANGGNVTVVGSRETNKVPNTTLVASGAPFETGVQLETTPSHGTGENDLFGAATAADGSTWAVGWYLEPETFLQRTLVLHGVNGQWSLVESPSPSSEENGLAAVTAIPGGGLWAVGITTDKAGNPTPLIEFHR
jgi:hypothetical protein